ncbi:putative expansin-B2 [Salvia miltiorrhiza]|uniref:putative expansin-B2 n=1 Tax=Salvia miltiorrhiza TaxID=226208 RepID=UPI0025AD79B5|nr:putative expansin-B2 [Salvia miltiorrhiza]
MLMASLFTHFAFFTLIANLCYGFHPRLLNVSKLQNSGSDWSPARASWYGNPSGAGSDGGACGYQNAVEEAPYSSRITAAASSLYKSGEACGTCYQVKCTTTAACSGKAVTVVITDECPGCDSQSILFDLSGTSFGTMARPGEADQLRNVGIEQIQYKRVECNFPGVTVAFRVDPGSNPNYFAAAIEYEDGDGITGVELRRAAESGGAWIKMQPSWGAVWKADLPNNYPPPFSFRLTGGGDSGKTIVANNVIPANYSPGKTYRSVVNF